MSSIIGVDAPGRKIGALAVIDLESGQYRDSAIISVGRAAGEREDYKMFSRQLDAAVDRHNPVAMVAVEHPFLFIIAQWVGALKLWSVTRGIPWYMVTAPSAKKSILGDGKAEKAAVLKAMQRHIAKSTGVHDSKQIVQHEADAVLYALAARRYLQKDQGRS